jgi:hypothetical protein
MKHRTIVTTIAGAVAVVSLAGGAVALAVGGESDSSVTGPGAEQAKAAALAETGGGRVNAVERDSEHGATWEVEVTKPGGSTVDVRLDAAFHTVVVDPDTEDAGTSTNGS